MLLPSFSKSAPRGIAIASSMRSISTKARTFCPGFRPLGVSPRNASVVSKYLTGELRSRFLATASTRCTLASKARPGWPSISTFALWPTARPPPSPSSTNTCASSLLRSGSSATVWLGQTVSPTATASPRQESGKTRMPSCGAATLSARRLFDACSTRSSAFLRSISASAMSAAARRSVGSRLATVVSTRFCKSERSSWLSRIWLREKIWASVSDTSSARFRSSSATPRSRPNETPECPLSERAFLIFSTAESRSERPSANCFSTSVGSKTTTVSPLFTGPAAPSQTIRIGRCKSGGTLIGVERTAWSCP